MKSDLNN